MLPHPPEVSWTCLHSSFPPDSVPNKGPRSSPSLSLSTLSCLLGRPHASSTEALFLLVTTVPLDAVVCWPLLAAHCGVSHGSIMGVSLCYQCSVMCAWPWFHLPFLPLPLSPSISLRPPLFSLMHFRFRFPPSLPPPFLLLPCVHSISATTTAAASHCSALRCTALQGAWCL